MAPGDFIEELLAKNQPVNVEISRNKMEAYLKVYSLGGGQQITGQDIEAALREKGVIYGVLEEIVDKAVSLQHFSEPITVARGSEPIPGEDSKIDFKFNTDIVIGKPIEMMDGRVDYYNLNLIQNVEIGEVLAVKTPASKGTPGYTVTGEEVPAKPGKDFLLKPGKNVQMVAGDNVGYKPSAIVAVSAAQGRVMLTGNKITVSTVYEVDGDVDFNTGNIEFNGSVIIKGSIREGFKVVANGDVVIMNTISDGIVECTGNVKVKSGIVGRSKTRIKAGESVFAKFIENSTVEAAEDIVVSEAIMHSRVSAGKSVVVGGKGVVVGGLIRAGEEIKCKIVGSPLATATELEAGINPVLRKEYSKLTKEKESKETDHDKADKAIKLLKRMQYTQGEMHPDKRALLIQVTKVQVALTKDLEALNESTKNIEFQMVQSNRGRITVQGTIYPGVKVTIGSSSVQIHDPYPFVCFTKHNGEIKISPYK
ncbi:MAG: DUF342 domain-containing protein [Eubacteriales bacterium]